MLGLGRAVVVWSGTFGWARLGKLGRSRCVTVSCVTSRRVWVSQGGQVAVRLGRVRSGAVGQGGRGMVTSVKVGLGQAGSGGRGSAAYVKVGQGAASSGGQLNSYERR
jgi:hypothetical protein